ncbi:uncharacterized protein OCT59_020389 [Rhizophagus irregularis]|nr:hypothetical protein RhiirB3_424025 [Rhizophagus irregularis]UZO01883.1 hypothetical protein OCT59_020389 [Rhizophagus irregularis]
MNKALKNEILLQVFTSHHKDEGDSTKRKIELIESSLNNSSVKTAYDEDVARVFLTGVTPVVLAEFISDNIKEGIVSWLKEENDGYFFRHNQPEEIFNTAHILYYVRKLMKQKSKLDDSWDPSVILNIQ